MSFKKWRNILIVFLLLVLALVGIVNYMVVNDTKDQIYRDVNAIPKNKVGLLLGTAKYMDKAKNIINPYYQYRIDAAVALYMAGKIDYVIVSGDNSTQYYNEPLLMKRDLISKGVPEGRIFFDNAGFRTLDSILRCRDIFGQTKFTVISQAFHNERAIYIANRKNVTTVGFCAADGDAYISEFIREKMARVKMMIDLLLNKQAKYYGDKVEIK
ncbi:protein SanA [Flavipsychrobacter stenotrophus]|uniref:Protein SanA n=2 Tax=Flavipsychrobacter stenotrophus TaxID=2077091 RepID=A0A2S7SZM9_9BACT|nr:protein SanA [Flavipsychrobacter stenotrophus]